MALQILKNIKYHKLLEKALGLCVICSKFGNKYMKIFKEEKSTELSLSENI